MAAYHHVRDYRDTPGFLLIQHGSYQWGSAEYPSRRGLALSGHRTGPSGSLLAIPARRTLARERGNMAKVPARPSRHVVGLDPVFQHDP
jgi:hypothetical protein